MARLCAAHGRALSAARASPGGTSRRTNAGDVLGSRRSSRRLYRERIAHGVTAGADGIAFGPQDEGHT